MKQWQNLTDMFSVGNIQSEMVKKYKGTILGMSDGKKTFYCKYAGATAQGYEFHDKHNMCIELINETKLTVFIPPLEKGLYNTEDCAVYISRPPNRQYRRGLNPENVMIQDLIFTTLQNLSQPYINKFNTIIYEVLQTEYYPISTALEMLANKSSVAITKQFAVQHHHIGPGVALYYYKYYIGDVVGKTIVLKNTVFKQEVWDTKEEWCPDYTIILDGV